MIYPDAIKSRKCLWFQEVVVRFDLVRDGAIGGCPVGWGEE